MLDRLNGYDWQEVFACCSSLEHGSNTPSIENIPDESTPLDEFSREDVVCILAIDDGENDERDWITIVELKDGRFATVSAGCDYTGWDCRSGGGAVVCRDLALLWKLGTCADARERFMQLTDIDARIKALIDETE